MPQSYTRSLDRPAARNKRFHIRFDKVLPVELSAGDFGHSKGVARNISAGGMFVETADGLPIGQEVTVALEMHGGGSIVVRALVQHRYSFNFQDPVGPASCRGLGLRFVEFLEDTPPNWLKQLTETCIFH